MSEPLEELSRYNQEALGNSLKISEIKPADIGEQEIASLRLRQQIAGYNFSSDPEYVTRRIKELYQQDDGYKIIYLAFLEDLSVASLILKKFPQVNGDEYAERFWQALRQESPTIAKASQNQSAYHVAGISVLPEMRRRNIARNLMKAAFADLQPAFVLGGTKLPEQAEARSHALAELGFRTFYGNYEITPQSQLGETSEHLPILNAYLYSLKREQPFYFSRNLPPGIPVTTGFGKNIQQAFSSLSERIRNGAEEQGQGALIQPLVSAKLQSIT